MGLEFILQGPGLQIYTTGLWVLDVFATEGLVFSDVSTQYS